MNTKNGVDTSSILLLFNKSTRKSFLFNLGGSLLGKSHLVVVLVLQGFRMVVGNDLNVDFWTDDWIGTVSLKEAFPIIFALARIKHGSVVKFRSWNQEIWHWEVFLR